MSTETGGDCSAVLRAAARLAAHPPLLNMRVRPRRSAALVLAPGAGDGNGLDAFAEPPAVPASRQMT